MNDAHNAISPTFTLHPAVIIGIGICPALAGATGLREAAILGAGIVAVQIFTMVALAPVRAMILPRFAPLITAVTAGGFTAILVLLGMAVIPDLLQPITRYAYLTPVGLPVLCAARWLRHDGGKGAAARSCLTSASGATVLLIVVGALREVLASGGILGKSVFAVPLFPWVATISGGVTVAALVLSIAAAVMKALRSRKGRGAN